MKGVPSAATMTVQVKSNRLPQLKAALPGIIQERVTKAAEHLRQFIEDALDNGDHGLETDTGALARSLTVKTPFGSDYDERLAKAAAAYLGNPSRWRDLVRANISAGAYTDAHFADRVADEEPLGQPTRGEAIAAVSTMLAWGFFWEFGHTNELTGQYEHRPWMGPEADQFEAREWEAHFHDLFKDFK